MDLPNAKDLKKLADMCRKAGIKSFKGNGIEFTLSEDAPVSTYKKAKAAQNSPDKDFESDGLTEEELLFWSAGGNIPSDSTESKGD